MKKNMISRKIGRPTLHKAKMIRRTYQITREQDSIIKEFANDKGISKSAALREFIMSKNS